MTGILRIGVLGEFTVFNGESAAHLPQSRKTRALLAYLAVTGKAHRRERLCELFWDVPDDPRGALRWSLSKIRAAVDDGRQRLLADRNTVQLDLRDVDLDIGGLSGGIADELPALQVSRLEELARRFRGSFLEDLPLPRCPEFEAWRAFHADSFERLHLRILRELASRLESEPGRALPHLHALRRLDPEDTSLDERIARAAGAARLDGRHPSPVQAIPEHLPGSGASLADQTIGFCKARDGTRIAFAATGDGPPIVRAAHWMSHLQHDLRSPVWRHWITGLSLQNRLIRYDERCNGMSDWDAEDVSFETMVSDLETVVDAAGVDRFTLLGISQSCAVSVAFAIRHPERVSGLILYGGYVKGWRKRGSAREIATREALATLMRVGWGQDNPIFRQLFTSQFIPGANAEQIDSFDELQRITVSPENAWRLQNMFGDIDVAGLLCDVRVPTLVLHARDDKVAPYLSGRCFATDIAGARLVELDSSNHILLEDEPAFAQFLAEVRAFASTPGGADRALGDWSGRGARRGGNAPPERTAMAGRGRGHMKEAVCT
jgi:pimeloyl-ACP methyl ester carboxylesterase/DNA-binding SARP family transcriptional activator